MRTRPHPFTLRQLQYVVAVADHLSFRGAAAACAVSQPSLSAQVQEVESQLGSVLFVRDKRSVALTTAGQAFVASARALLAAADALADQGTHLADPFAGPLRVGVIPTLAPGVVGPISQALRARFTKMTPRVREAQTHVVLESIVARGVDVAVLARTDDTASARFEREAIGDDPFSVAIHRGHALAARASLTVDDLVDTGLLLLEEGHCLREHALAACRADAVVDHDFQATSIDTLLALVADGKGATLVPRTLTTTAARNKDIAIVPFSPTAARQLEVVWLKGDNDDARRAVAQVIRDAVRAVLA